MWLDRFSGHSTPSGSPPPHNRSHSPAPKRTSHLAPSQRSGLGLTTGSSTLSLGLSSNGSNVSLPATTSRLANGSSLRQEHRPSSNVPDPLKILRSILGVSSKEDDEQDLTRRPPDWNTDIDFGERSLEDYAGKDNAEVQIPSISPRPPSPRSFDELEKYRGLHDAIQNCDNVLKPIESYLTNFQNELGAVSAEIESLQTRSAQLTAKLENRRRVEIVLGPAVEEISVSPATVRTISEGPLDDNWVRALGEIENRSAAVASKRSEQVKAVGDVTPLLENLKAKAVERIRDFVVAQIKALRSPNVNAQIVQQQTLIKYKSLYTFMAKHNPVLGDEIGQAYVNTMRWYYSNNFVRYQQALDKLHLHVIDQTELLGADSTTARRGVMSSTKAPSPQHDAFSLGLRSEVLRSKAKNAISSSVAEESKLYHYLDAPFYNFNLALIDNICSEYSVVTELFSTKTFQEVSRKVVEIFEPSFSLGRALTKQLIESNTDCLGVLLCVRINQQFAFELQKRKVPVADSYINGTNMILWPRFQILMDLHCDSLKRVTAPSTRGGSTAAAAAVAAFSLVGSDNSNNTSSATTNATNTTSTSKPSLAPHPVTQRFGQFLHAILTLSATLATTNPSRTASPDSAPSTRP